MSWALDDSNLINVFGKPHAVVPLALEIARRWRSLRRRRGAVMRLEHGSVPQPCPTKSPAHVGQVVGTWFGPPSGTTFYAMHPMAEQRLMAGASPCPHQTPGPRPTLKHRSDP